MRTNIAFRPPLLLVTLYGSRPATSPLHGLLGNSTTGRLDLSLLQRWSIRWLSMSSSQHTFTSAMSSMHPSFPHMSPTPLQTEHHPPPPPQVYEDQENPEFVVN